MNYFSRAGVDYTGRTAENIIDLICIEFGITKEKLNSKCRLRHVVDARTIAAYHLHKELGFSSLATGLKLNRNHASILHLCKKAEGLIEVDKEFKQLINKFI